MKQINANNDTPQHAIGAGLVAVEGLDKQHFGQTPYIYGRIKRRTEEKVALGGGGHGMH